MNIYAGNLSYSLTEEDLKRLFRNYGIVSTVSLVKDKYTGESKGFGFVEMPSVKDAKAAIEGLNGYDIKGRSITVNEAIPKASNGQSEARQRKHTGSRYGNRR